MGTSAKPLNHRAIRASRLRRRAPRHGALLLEILLTLILFAVCILPLYDILNAATEESGRIVAIRTAQALAQAKLEELLTGIEEGSGGGFKNEKGDEIPGYEWSTEERPVDYWPDPADDPNANTPTGFSPVVLTKDQKDSLITMIELTLTVKYPGCENSRTPEGDAGQGLKLVVYKIPTEDDIREHSLDYR